jgi:signal transduction histidine kinase
MRLGDFIEASVEPILHEWEAFARSIAAGVGMDALTLRDHAADLLLAVVQDMRTAQTATERSEKGKGLHTLREGGAALNLASNLHAMGRLGSGFDLMEVVSEYRALRASVLRLWQESLPVTDVGDVEDVTRFNEAIDQLIAKSVRSYTLRVDQARDMFLAILSHDLRNPLNSIGVSAQVLPAVKHDDEKSRIYTSQIATNVSVMGRMISDLLDYTRTRLGAGMPVSPAWMNLAVLGRAVFDEFRSSHPDRKVQFNADADLTGEWDTDRLRQALSNLLGNALQHGDPGQPVVLSIKRDGEDVRIDVHNGGEPIAPGELSRIFDPLVRGTGAHEPRRNRPGSIGLGLYIAREVARSHGGRIDVTSTVADGTRFIMHLPRHANISARPPVMDEAAIIKM